MKGVPEEMFTLTIGEMGEGGSGGGPESVVPASIAPIHLPDGEVIRPFDLRHEDVGRLIALKEAVYGKPVDRAVFEWQYFRHPRAADIRVSVVEQRGEIVAATTRFPATFRLDGEDCPAFFNIDSMVHPDHRRKGRMRDLYRFARALLPPSALLFSKGSSSQIYPLLLSIGHQEITPNTHLVSYPSATRWLMSRLRLRGPSQVGEGRSPAGFEEFRAMERFDADFDAFFRRVAARYSALFVRDAAYMNWRYRDVPHRRYVVFQRVVNDRMAAVVVLSVHGDQGQIVDVLWDPDAPDAPERCVRFAQAYFDEHQCVRVVCFATHPRLRDVLNGAGFLDRGETPRFSAFIPPSRQTAFQRIADLHVVDGDGDTEFS